MHKCRECGFRWDSIFDRLPASCPNCQSATWRGAEKKPTRLVTISLETWDRLNDFRQDKHMGTWDKFLEKIADTLNAE